MKIKKIFIVEASIVIFWFLIAHLLKKAYVGTWTLDEIRYYYQDMVGFSTIQYSDGTTEVLKIPFSFYAMLAKAFIFNYPITVYFLYLITRITMYIIWQDKKVAKD